MNKETDRMATAGAVVEWLGEVVAGHVVARLPCGAVGIGGISPDLYPDHRRVARKRSGFGRDGQCGERFLTRIAYPSQVQA